MLLRVGFVVVLQCLSASAQVYFSQPIGGEIIMGGVPFIVSVYDSLSVPYFGQMKNFSLLFLTGTYNSPLTIYAWNLSSTNPSSVSTSIIFPRALAPNATNAYFLGIQGSLISNTSISTTYYSSLFSLQNMTGTSSVLPFTPPTPSDQSSIYIFPSTTVVSVVTATPSRSISCLSSSGEETIGEIGGNGGINDPGCESAALSAFALLATQTRTLTAGAAPLVTSPPAFPQFAALLAEATASSESATSTISSVVPTTTSSNNGLGPATSTSVADSSSETAKMTYMLIIAGITLATVVLLFWIWTRYRRSRQPAPASSPCPPTRCTHISTECDCSRLRKMYDGVVAEFNFLRLGSISRKSNNSSEAEKGLANQGARPGTAGSRNGLVISSGESPTLSTRDNDERRRRFEDEYRRRRASRASQRSQRTVLAELEGDLGPYGTECEDVVPPMPGENARFALFSSNLRLEEEEERYERIMRTRNKTFAVRRETMVGEGKSGVVVRGKVAANIVAVRRKPVGGAATLAGVTRGRIDEGSELDFPALIRGSMLVCDGVEEETRRRNGGEIMRDGREREVKLSEAEEVEAAIRDAMKQTKLSDLRRERRRRKREELANGGGSRDLGIAMILNEE